MALLDILRTGFEALLMRSHAAKYAACVVLACAAAVVVAVPVFGQTTSVTLVGAGDIANCTHNNDEATAQLLGSTLRSLTPDGSLPPPEQARVLAMGDNAYPRGTRAQFANCYDNYRLTDGSPYDSSRPAWWGQYKDRTMPVLGNHEYLNSDDPNIASKPYFDYFSANQLVGFQPPAAPVPNDPVNDNNHGLTFGEGYYSYDLGSWHIVALNSNCEKVGGCDASSPQGQWLQRDLAAHPETTNSQCTLAYFHHPRYATGNGTNTPNVKPFWDMLYANGTDVILSGHAHRYERHAPMTPEGVVDRTNGIRPLVVGTGGEPGGSEIHTEQVPPGVLEKVVIDEFGVIKLDLSAGSYTWTFSAVDGTANGTVMDSSSDVYGPGGSEQCHGAPGSLDTTPPETTIDSGPSGTVKSREATFTFSSTEPSNATFQTRLDGGIWEAPDPDTATSKTYSNLANGTHTFEVKATDAAGNEDPTPDSRSWKVRAR
jgi:acid phosphatase type 7